MNFEIDLKQAAYATGSPIDLLLSMHSSLPRV